MLTLDTETTGLDWHRNKVTHVGLLSEGEFKMAPIGMFEGSWRLTDVRDRHRERIVMHHGRFDTLMLHGTSDIWVPWTYDTMLLSQLYDSRVKHSLDNIGRLYLGEGKWGDPKVLKVIKRGEFWTLPEDIQRAYLERDCSLTSRLFDFFKKRMDPALFKLYETFDRPISLALVEIERYGFRINEERLREYKASLQEKLIEPTRLLQSEFGAEVDLNSPKQLLPILRRVTGFDLEDTDERTLVTLAQYAPCVKVLLEYRMLTKYLNTYIEGIEKRMWEGAVYPSFHLAGDYHESKGRGTATGRTSSSNPNFQNIPTNKSGPDGINVRSLFIARPGYKLMAFDYNQIELRVASFLSKETNLASGDLHAQAAEILKRDRSVGKTANFAKIYGAKENKLRYISGGSPNVKKYIRWFEETFPRAVEWTNETIRDCEKSGKVATYLGRVRYLDRAEVGPNSIVQGSAGDIAKEGLLKVHQRGFRILGIVHDELVLEVPEGDGIHDAAVEVPKLMTDGLTANAAIHQGVPLNVSVKIGEDWGHMNEYSHSLRGSHV